MVRGCKNETHMTFSVLKEDVFHFPSERELIDFVLIYSSKRKGQ